MGHASYRDERGWVAYQRFFRPDLRLTTETEPAEEWWSWRDIDVHVDRYAAEGPVKVLLLHGAGGYSRLVSPLAVALRDRGYEAIAPDLPGYGLTETPRPRANTWELWVELVADLLAVERRRDERPVVLFGASIGGPLALHAAGRPGAEPAGLIATMLLDPRDPATRRVLGPPWAPPAATSALLRAPSALDGLRLPIKLLTNLGAIANDEALARLCARDPLGGGNRVPVAFLGSLLDADPPLEPEAFDRCPVLLVHPGEDRWTPLVHSRRVFDRIAAAKELQVLEGCGHFPLEEPGLTQMTEAIERFLARVAASG